MKKTNIGFMLLVVAILLIGCFDPPEANPALGKWIITETYSSIFGGLFTDSSDVAPEFDDNFSATLYLIEEDMMMIYNNIPESGDYTVDTVNILGFTSDSILVDDETMEFKYMLMDDQFVLNISLIDEHTGLGYVFVKLTFDAYSGSLPPACWLTGLQPDAYELNNTASSATQIVCDQLQTHTMYSGDIDYFGFTATAGQTYLLQLYSETVDLKVTLQDDYEQYIDADDDNDDDIEGLEGNVESALLWTADRTGLYYFMVELYDEDDLGYYKIKVTESNSSMTKALGKTTPGEKDPSESNMNFKGTGLLNTLMGK